MRLAARWRRRLVLGLLLCWVALVVSKAFLPYIAGTAAAARQRRQGTTLQSNVIIGNRRTTTLPATSPEQQTTKQSTSSPCDEECQNFRRLLLSWPTNDTRPRAVIYYLVRLSSLSKLNTSIQYLDNNFNNRYRYPVIVFVEDDLDNDVGRRTIRSFTGSDDLSQSRLFIQVVRFRIPDFITGRVPPRAGNGKSVGYRHMCRFHAKTVYEEPTIGFKYADGRPVIEYTWRLDDDSFLYRPIKYDPFAFMRDRQLLYGYIQVREEARSLIRGLWEAVDEFLVDNPLIKRTQWYGDWRRTKIFYNNFEISALSIWTSIGYQQYVDYIDRRGGIYYVRWGDAPIKTIGVTLFVDRNKTHLFKDIGYKHNVYTNKGRGR